MEKGCYLFVIYIFSIKQGHAISQTLTNCCECLNPAVKNCNDAVVNQKTYLVFMLCVKHDALNNIGQLQTAFQPGVHCYHQKPSQQKFDEEENALKMFFKTRAYTDQ